jgi:hypothetical protein
LLLCGFRGAMMSSCIGCPSYHGGSYDGSSSHSSSHHDWFSPLFTCLAGEYPVLN